MTLLQTPQNLCYISGVNAKKALIGCESPKARGAEPHPARIAAFLYLAPFGGPNGEAQASPVTLRVPRSLTPIRAAAQCESWSAVVHQAQLETIMAQPFSALELAQLHLKHVFKSWESEREQLHALVCAIHDGLEPEPGADCDVYQEWRLSQVALNVLDDASEINALQKMAGVAR